MNCFFDDNLVLKTLGREDIFDAQMNICRPVKRAIGVEILSHMNQRQ